VEEKTYLTVTALNKYIERKFKLDPYLGEVYIKGEISNFKPHGNNIYFSIKDENSVIRANWFGARSKDFKDGDTVLIKTKVDFYLKRGEVNLVVLDMKKDRIGELYQKFLELKEKLEKEGLFSPQYKKRIPSFSQSIAVITAKTGAAVQDITRTIQRRFPIAKIKVYSTLVQGDNSVQDIVRNIKLADEENNDVIILGRGGGSIEDLWAFNEEPVVRRVAELSIPVISSVGHETDTTLIDFVSDMRAATPTAAAEIATPVLMEIHQQLRNLQTRLEQALTRQLQIKRERMQALANASIFQNPERIYQVYQQRVDQLEMRLQQMMQQSVQQKRQQLLKNQHRLELGSPSRRVQTEKQTLQYLAKRLEQAQIQLMKDKKQQFQRAIQQLDLLSPLKIMNRGYGILQQEETIIKSVDQLEVEQELTIQLVDGTVRSKVTSVEKGNQLW